MNRQLKLNPDGTIKSRQIEWCDFTINPISGCDHDCKWLMPDGNIAECYAKTVADRFRGPKFYPNGFSEVTFHPDRLKEPLKEKESARIFFDSMSDLMSNKVPVEWIRAAFGMCNEAWWHKYLLLTKNPTRLPKFNYPSNVQLGISLPPTFFKGAELTEDIQRKMFRVGLQKLLSTDAQVKWVSFEPLSWNPIDILQDCPPLDWAVIGAASDGLKIYQPNPDHVAALVSHLRERGTKVFFKGNLMGNAGISEWLEEVC